MKLNVDKFKTLMISKGQNGLVIDNTKVPIKRRIESIPLTQEQQQNFKFYGSLNKPEVKQTYLNQGRKLTPAEQQASNKKLAGQGKLQAYQKQKEKEAKDLQRAAEVAPYVIPGIGQAMWAGKAIDLATSGLSDGKYESWGDMVSQATGDPEWLGDLTNPGYYAGVVSKLATPLIKKGVQRIPINYSNYSNLRSIEIPRFKSFTNSFNDQKALQTASDQFTNRNTFYRGVKGTQNLDEAAQMLTTVDGKIRPNLRQGIPEGNNSGVIYSSVNPKRAEVFAGGQGYVGRVSPVQIKGNNLTEFIDNNLIGNRKDLIFNKQIDGTPQLISFGNPQQQVMNLQGFVGNSNKLPITKPLVNRNSNTIRKTTINKAEPYLMGDKRIPINKKVKNNFESEINWGNWNKEIPSNKPLMDEYLQIEKTAKQNGTWMKNPDGSAFKGTPEQFVQQNSNNFKKAFPSGHSLTYRGDRTHYPELDYNPVFTGDKQMALNYTQDNASYWTPNHPFKARSKSSDPTSGGLHELYYNPDRIKIKIDAKNNDYTRLKLDEIAGDDYVSTDDIARRIASGHRDAEINNVYDASVYPGTVRIINHNFGSNNFMKSARGNNGMFDMTNPNIYKAVVPAAGLYGLTQSKKQGGTIYIKPENKGKFTATKKATGKTTEELTHSKNPLTKKRAIFAQNAKKWKHQEGGTLKAQEGTILKSNLPITTNPGELTGYNMFRSTLPSNQANNGKFNLFQGWKNYNKPSDFKTALKSNGNTPFITRESDSYHAKSVGYNKESGNYDFLKDKNHQSLQYELNWYNSKDGESFRNQYDLDTSGDYYKYVPKKSFLEIDKSKQSFLNGGKLNKTK